MTPKTQSVASPTRTTPGGSVAGKGLQLSAIAYVASVPLDALTLFPGRSPTAILGLVLIAAWLLDLVTNGPISSVRSRTSLVYVPAVLFVTWGAVAQSWSANPGASLERLPTYIGLVLSTPALARAFRHGKTAPLVAYVMSATILAVFALLDRKVVPSGVVSNALGDAEYRARPLSTNPNGAALLLGVGLGFAIYLAFRSSKVSRWAYGASAVLCLLGMLSAGSKTGFISLVLLAVCTPPIVSSIDRRRHRLRLILVSSTVVAGAVLLAWQVRGLFPERMWLAFQSVEEGNLTRRQDIWVSALNASGDWLPWGLGINNSTLLTASHYGRAIVLHNVLLEAGVELGIVGITTVLIFYLGLIICTRYSLYKVPVLLALIPVLTFSLSLSMFYYKVLWFVAALATVNTRDQFDSYVGPSQRHSPWRPQTTSGSRG